MIKGKKHACIIKFLRKKMLFKVRFSNSQRKDKSYNISIMSLSAWVKKAKTVYGKIKYSAERRFVL